MSSTLSGVEGLYTSDYWKNTQTTKDLEKTLESDISKKSEAELMDACKDFESYLVEQMFKAMQKMVPKNEEEENDYTEMFGDMLTREYAKSATNQKSLGIAQTLYEQMKRNYGL